MNSPEPCALVGILDDGHAGLGDAARHRVAAADLVIGARRTLELIAPHLSPGAEQRAMDGQLGQVAEWARAARHAGRRVAVLATGDPLCHGIGSFCAATSRAAGLH
jgi:precorrin-6Y C5,15-methyltransferase (decarboxylating)